jgi:type I restriction enzyme S subunit
MTMPFVEKYLYSLGIGAGQPNISANDILNIKIDSPSISIQQKIASILSTYDFIIENNKKRIKLLEQMAENLYKEWFVRFRFPGHESVEMENGLPKGWKVERVKDCVKRLPYGRTYKANELSTDGKVIVIDQSTSNYLGYHDNEPSHFASFDSPIILFGDHSCKFCFMTRDFSLGENVIPFKSKDIKLINDYYLFYSVHKLIVTEEYKRHWGRFSSMKILIPSIELQHRFCKHITYYEKLKQKLMSQNTYLTRQRDLLLPRLMSGKLEVKP